MAVGSGRWLLKTMRTRSPCVDLDGRARRASVEAPKVESLARYDGLLYRLGDQMKDLHAVVYRVRQIGYVRCYDRDRRLRRMSAVLI